MTRDFRPFRHALAFGLALFLLAGPAWARDEEYQRLSDRIDRLAADPVLGQRAPAQLDRARAALAEFKEAGRRDRERLVYLVERRIDTAQAVAEADYLENQRTELQRENDRLQLAIARRDAAQARAELERQRLQSQIRAEEAERLAREAEAARAEGAQAAQAAEAARAEANQAKRMADAQARATALAKKEAELEAALNGKAPKADAQAKPKAKPTAKPAPKPKKVPPAAGKP
jgi:membrane protein involved in colicin uptake